MGLAKPEILLLSGYDADSHRRWHEGLVRHMDQFNWTVLTLPARYFSWRIRGNPLSWSFRHADTFARNYDALVATSMVDVATLKGLIPNLAHTPCVVYFHENQFGYPKSDRQKHSIEAQMVNLYSALAANQIVFNSDYNRDTFIAGVEDLLAKLPDHTPSGLTKRLQQMASVIPVPLEPEVFDKSHQKTKRLTLVWNHRWEYDKAPERLHTALSLIKSKNCKFDLKLLGKVFRDSPEIFNRIKQDFSSELIEFGPIDNRQDYLHALRESDLVISTAIHDFQGLAVLEATAAGCVPMVPKHLAYPEFLPEPFLYQSYPDKPALEAQALAQMIIDAAIQYDHGQLATPPDLSYLDWNRLKIDYGKLLEKLIRQNPRRAEFCVPPV